MGKKLNIDIWRFIVSFLIVAIHISPFDKISPEFDFFFTRILGRIAVPLFLMITGYYILDKSLNDVKILKDYTKKILKIYFLCILLYLPINIYMRKFASINFIQIVKDILINGTLYHLWYFPALILGIWITYFLIKKMSKKWCFSIISILYLIGLLGDSYYGLTSINNTLSSIYRFIFHIFEYTRNGLFYTPIFIYMGYVIKKYKIKNKCSLISIFILFSCMTMEGMILHHYNLQKHDSMYIFLIPLMYFLFTYLMSHSKKSNKRIRSMATIIYISHPLFIVAIRFVSGMLGIENILVENNLILYLIVCTLTTIFAHFFEKAKGLVANGKH